MMNACRVGKIGCKGEKPRRYAACAVCWAKFWTLDKFARETGKYDPKNNPLGGSLRRYRA